MFYLLKSLEHVLWEEGGNVVSSVGTSRTALVWIMHTDDKPQMCPLSPC